MVTGWACCYKRSILWIFCRAIFRNVMMLVGRAIKLFEPKFYEMQFTQNERCNVLHKKYLIRLCKLSWKNEQNFEQNAFALITLVVGCTTIISIVTWSWNSLDSKCIPWLELNLLAWTFFLLNLSVNCRSLLFANLISNVWFRQISF